MYHDALGLVQLSEIYAVIAYRSQEWSRRCLGVPGFDNVLSSLGTCT
jgi:hypothetical protein